MDSLIYLDNAATTAVIVTPKERPKPGITLFAFFDFFA